MSWKLILRQLNDEHFQLQLRAFGAAACLRSLDGKISVGDKFDSASNFCRVAALERIHESVALRRRSENESFHLFPVSALQQLFGNCEPVIVTCNQTQ